ncbi:hypothetical protein DL546_005679 [Coniochaeta pulveracea]|uniref:Uncharacterized protein n=1 Tax=Coniochaeta pulveracea TaxID=177199 RepID=A0A420YI61_9PEZI|nr:hypothetical protein DL546_005679 [Coniochaeta pulveracea]
MQAASDQYTSGPKAGWGGWAPPPIIGGTIKSYKTIYKKLKLFAQASSEAGRVRRALKRQCDVFVNQIQILLHQVLVDKALLDEDVLDAMTKDGNHEGWKSPDIDARLERYFDRNYESYKGIVEEVAGEVALLLEEIEAFNGALAKEEGTIPGRREELSSRTRLAFDQTKCNKAVQLLRTSNEDLRTLCEQVSQLKHPDNLFRPRRNSSALASTGSYGFIIRKTASALHQGLSDNLHDRNHDVRLFIQPSIAGEATVMNIVLRCADDDDERPVRDVVQVRSYAASTPPTPPPESSMRYLCISDKPSGRRGVKWSDQLGRSSQGQRSEEHNREGQRLQNRARPTNNLCLELCRDARRKGKLAEDECFCYVETHVAGEAFRHNFHPSDVIYQHATKPATLENLLVDFPAVEAAMTKRDQLMLARAVVLAVLYFSSSPWLPDFWALGNLSYFPDECGNLRASLRTVNLGVTISGAQPGSHGTARSDPSIEDLMLEYGIRNVPLHYLGAVLLQIDRWQLIDSGDVPHVRKLAKQRSELEADYHNLIEKCLHCDFGVDAEKDLSRPELWQAVHQDVVERLDRMIDLLDPFS